MNIYSEEHRIFQESVRKFAEREILPYVDDWEKRGSFPSEIFKSLGAQGFLGILIEEQLAGVGGDFTLASAWCEEFGRIPCMGFCTGVNMHSLVILPTVARYGSEKAKEKWIPRGLRGEAIGAYAFSEPGAGSDLSAILTTAKKDGKNYVLNGSKTFITNGARADFIIVLAKTDPSAGYKGFTSFLVDSTLSGFSISRTLDKLGWHASDTAELSFTDVVLSEDDILGEVGKGWSQAMSNLEWERLMLSLSACGGARECLERTVGYVKERKVFGKTVGSFDVNRELILNLFSKLQASEADCRRCVDMLNKKKPCRIEVSSAKLNTCEFAIKLADHCLQLHGGYGYTSEFPPERWLRDLRLNTIGGGTSQIMSEIISKEIF